MAGKRSGWEAFDARTPLLTCAYSFGPGAANAVAVGIDGGLAVVSPPCRVDDAVLDQLAEYGPVRALVAPNAFHTMGVARWRARFPDAGVFAPAQSIGRVQRTSGVSGIRPLAELAALAGPKVEFVDMPHYRSGEALVRVRSARGLVWHVTDIVLNLSVLPPHPIAKLMFGLTRSAPGLKFNNFAGLLMVRDKPALKRWLAEQVDAAPPAWLIPSHGRFVEVGDDVAAVRALFAS